MQYHSQLLKTFCVRQVVSDKWFPLIMHRAWTMIRCTCVCCGIIVCVCILYRARRHATALNLQPLPVSRYGTVHYLLWHAMLWYGMLCHWMLRYDGTVWYGMLWSAMACYGMPLQPYTDCCFLLLSYTAVFCYFLTHLLDQSIIYGRFVAYLQSIPGSAYSYKMHEANRRRVILLI